MVMEALCLTKMLDGLLQDAAHQKRATCLRCERSAVSDRWLPRMLQSWETLVRGIAPMSSSASLPGPSPGPRQTATWQ